MPFGVFKKIIGAPLKVASKLLPGQTVKKAIGGGGSSGGSGGSFSKYGVWAGDDAPRSGVLPSRRSLPGYTMGYGGGPPPMYGYGRGPPGYGGFRGFGGGYGGYGSFQGFGGGYGGHGGFRGFGGGYGGHGGFRGFGGGYGGYGGGYVPQRTQWSTPWGSPVRPPPQQQQAPQQGFDFESFAKEWKNRPPRKIRMDMVRVRKPDGSIATVNRGNPIYGATTVEGSGYTVDPGKILGITSSRPQVGPTPRKLIGGGYSGDRTFWGGGGPQLPQLKYRDIRLIGNDDMLMPTRREGGGLPPKPIKITLGSGKGAFGGNILDGIARAIREDPSRFGLP